MRASSSTRMRMDMGSLSTSTPSQSKMMRPSAGNSAHPIAAVDVQSLGHDIVGFRRSEKDRSPRDIVRPAHAAEWHGGAYLALLLANWQVFVARKQGVDAVPHRRIDDTWCDPIDVDSVLDQRQAG